MKSIGKIDEKRIPAEVIQLLTELHESEYEAYLVGGCVRDMLIGEEPHDWDICTSARPVQMMSLFQDKLKRHVLPTGIEHGTVTIMMGGTGYEITTYRTDGDYSDGRHPDSVEFASSIRDDLLRRDFTINAIAYSPITHELVDPFNGVKDIEQGVIVAVGDPKERFLEDALRILRGMRFSIKYDYKIEENTSKYMHEYKERLDIISKERITQEFEKMLTCGKPIKTVFMEYSDIVSVVIPEIKDCIGFWQNNKYHKHNVYEHILYVVDYCETTDFCIKMAALLHDIAKPVAYVTDEEGHGHFYGHPEMSYEISLVVLKEDFRVTSEQYDLITRLVRYHDDSIAGSKPAVKRALNKHGVDFIFKWFVLRKADQDDHIYGENAYKYVTDIPKVTELIHEIEEENACFKIKDLDINGHDIMKLLSIKPCEHIGTILSTLLDEVINEKIENKHDKLMSRTIEIYERIK